MPPSLIEEDVPFGALTTLACGGAARFMAECLTPREVREVVSWARAEGIAIHVHGGGSNTVVSDQGFDGLVLRYTADGVRFDEVGEHVLVHAAGGGDWDTIVEKAVTLQLRGISCLRGIPGTVGAAPVQNIGAYGQEVGSAILHVDAIDLGTLRTVRFDADACEFGYRRSVFKAHPGRYLIAGVTLTLARGGPVSLAYRALQEAFPEGTHDPAAVAAWVLKTRRQKSMVYDQSDPNHRSAGSFFTNPVVPRSVAEAIAGDFEGAVPMYPAGEGQIKLSAAWLIDNAGLHKGLRRGNVGLSSEHTLALINRGGATTAELIALAREVQGTVRARFGVMLHAEPLFVGFETHPLG